MRLPKSDVADRCQGIFDCMVINVIRVISVVSVITLPSEEEGTLKPGRARAAQTRCACVIDGKHPIRGVPECMVVKTASANVPTVANPIVAIANAFRC